MNKKCCFCNTVRGGAEELWNQMLLQTTNFVVLPTVGAIVEGWVLIIPKKHYLCLASLDTDLFLEFIELYKFIHKILKDCYGPVTCFEHGPSNPKQPIGCGVDHAHLHMVPINCDFMAGVKNIFPYNLRWINVQNIQEAKSFFESGSQYLYLEQPNKSAYIATHPYIPSQLFRRVIANSVGKPNHYNWRIYHEENNVKSTANTIKNWLSQNSKESINQWVI